MADDDHVIAFVQPHSLLPKPEAPPGSLLGGLKSELDSKLPVTDEGDKGSFRGLAESFRFLKDRGSSLSTAIANTLSTNMVARDGEEEEEKVTEINLEGLKVVVKEEEAVLKGRVIFYSRSNCRDCTVVQRFFRERGLKFVEIIVDVFPSRENELIQRTGTSQVPQIFFNKKLLGGLVALNSLRISRDFDKRLREMLGRKCPGDTPAAAADPGPADEDEDRKELLLRVGIG